MAQVPQVTLVSSDEQSFKVEKKVAEMSVTIKDMIEDTAHMMNDQEIPLPNVTGKILEKVIQYCKYHHENPTTVSEDNKDDNRSDNISQWDKEFCTVDQATLFEMILASNYLDIKGMLDLTCKTVANMIKGKTPDEIRKTFNITQDFTPEEEEQVRKENSWINE